MPGRVLMPGPQRGQVGRKRPKKRKTRTTETESLQLLIKIHDAILESTWYHHTAPNSSNSLHLTLDLNPTIRPIFIWLSSIYVFSGICTWACVLNFFQNWSPTQVHHWLTRRLMMPFSPGKMYELDFSSRITFLVDSRIGRIPRHFLNAPSTENHVMLLK